MPSIPTLLSCVDPTHAVQRAGVRHAVLAAFGCGAFGNPGARVAELYREALLPRLAARAFDHVVFAIYHAGYGPGNFELFQPVLDVDMERESADPASASVSASASASTLVQAAAAVAAAASNSRSISPAGSRSDSNLAADTDAGAEFDGCVTPDRSASRARVRQKLQ
jgi:hypothetical protein